MEREETGDCGRSRIGILTSMSRRPASVAVLDQPAHAQALVAALHAGGFPNVLVEHRLDRLATFLASVAPAAVLVRTTAFPAQDPALLALLERVREWCPVLIIDQDAPLRGDSLHVGDLSALLARLRQALALHVDRDAPLDTAFGALVAEDPGMRSLLRYAQRVARGREPVLISGEPGSGKRLLARSLHAASGVPGAYVEVDLASLAEDESLVRLVGRRHRQGTTDTHAGAVLEASGGTLCIVGLGVPTPAVQAALLQIVGEGTYRPEGSDRTRRSLVRLICTVDGSDLDRQRLRPDLAQRLLVHHLRVPPLRERPLDLAPLCRGILHQLAGGDANGTTADCLRRLTGYAFPGNVRELQGLLADAWIRGGGLAIDDQALAEAISARNADTPAFAFGPRLPTLAEVQQALVDEALRRCAGHQGRAAAMLGITRQALNQRLHRRQLRTDPDARTA